MVRELLHSGLLQELITDPTGALLLAALGPSVADAPSMVGLLLRHGVPVTLPTVNAAVWRLNDNALKVLLVAGRPPVLLGSEDGPEHWRGDGEQCPLYNLLACQLDYPDTRARTAELLLATGRPSTTTLFSGGGGSRRTWWRTSGTSAQWKTLWPPSLRCGLACRMAIGACQERWLRSNEWLWVPAALYATD